MTFFKALSPQPLDEITRLVAARKADPRNNVIDLGIGVYRDETGVCSGFDALRRANQLQSVEQEDQGYLTLAGHEGFLREMSSLILGDELTQTLAWQTVGGTGGVRLALELTKSAQRSPSLYVGLPTWGNHVAIAKKVGLSVRTHSYHDPKQQAARFDEIMAAAAATRSGDVFIMHGPCHNPTGIDLMPAERLEIVRTLNKQGAIPLIDAAYYGLKDGLEQDLGQIKAEMSEAEEAMLVVSCSKAFGLYRERTGTLFIKTDQATKHAAIQQTLASHARSANSSPPSFGARLVTTVLSQSDLFHIWRAELDAMRLRLQANRVELTNKLADIDVVSRHTNEGAGLFTQVNLNTHEIAQLAEHAAIYLPESGRINLSGLNQHNMDIFISAIKALRNPA